MSELGLIPNKEREEVLQEIETSLLQSRGLEASDRDALLRFVAESLSAPQPASGIAPLHRQWDETLRLLREHDVLSQADCEQLAGELQRHLHVVDDPAVQAALRRAEGGAVH